MRSFKVLQSNQEDVVKNLVMATNQLPVKRYFHFVELTHQPTVDISFDG